MKTPRNKGQNLYLQTKNNRWKWMAGATAATAAGVTASQANAITITLLNNYISVFDFGGNHLNADLTGDGHPDLTIASAFNKVSGYFSPYYGQFTARVSLNGVLAQASRRNDGLPYSGAEQLGSRQASFFIDYYAIFHGTYSLKGSIPLFFKDLRINGGAPIKGSLQVTVSTRDPHDAEIQLDSFSYNTPTAVERSGLTVPDQGSSLALLAMGAGGVLALRRWRTKESSNPQLPAQSP